MGQQSRQRYAMRAAIAYFEQALAGAGSIGRTAPDAAIFDSFCWGGKKRLFKFKPYEEQLSQLARAEEIARRAGRQARFDPGLTLDRQRLPGARDVDARRAGFDRMPGPGRVNWITSSFRCAPFIFKGLMTSFADPHNALPWLDRAAEPGGQKYGDLHIEALALGTHGQVLAQLGEFAESQAGHNCRHSQVAARLGSPTDRI